MPDPKSSQQLTVYPPKQKYAVMNGMEDNTLGNTSLGDLPLVSRVHTVEDNPSDKRRARRRFQLIGCHRLVIGDLKTSKRNCHSAQHLSSTCGLVCRFTPRVYVVQPKLHAVWSVYGQLPTGQLPTRTTAHLH